MFPLKNTNKKLCIDYSKSFILYNIKGYQFKENIGFPDEQDGVYTLNSIPIKVNNWKHELYLFVDLYDSLNFYLKSVVDLSDYVVELTQNKNFNQLILVIFYMMENIKAKS